MLYALGIVLFLFGMLASIALHEVGHLIPAKRSGVKVTQYMVGFGPTLWSTHRGGTEYGLKAVPLGGYIRMIGMFPPRKERGEDATHLRTSSSGWMRSMVEDARSADVQRVMPEDADHVFYKKPVRNKLLIMLGGPTMNLVIGLTLLTVLLLSYGIGKERTLVGLVPQCVVAASEGDRPCKATDPEAPAKKAGLLPGDRIVAFNGTRVDRWPDLQQLIRSAGAATVRLTYVRNGATHEVAVPLIVTDRLKNPADTSSKATVKVGYLGVAERPELVRLSVGEVPGELGSLLGRTAAAVAHVPQRMSGVWKAAFGGGTRDPNGPIGVVGVGRVGGEIVNRSGATVDGGAQLLYLVASLNLALFFFNLIPLLPLDGGHVAGALYEGVRRQIARLRHQPDPGFADVAKMLPVAYTVAIALIAMSALLVYADLVNPVKLPQ